MLLTLASLYHMLWVVSETTMLDRHSFNRGFLKQPG